MSARSSDRRTRSSLTSTMWLMQRFNRFDGGLLLEVADKWPTTFCTNVHDFPEATPLTIVLRASIACPPVLCDQVLRCGRFHILILSFRRRRSCIAIFWWRWRWRFISILHVWPQYARYVAPTVRSKLRTVVRSVEPECDVDPCVGRLRQLRDLIWIGKVLRRRKGWVELVDRVLRRNAMLEDLLGRRMHDDEL